MSEELSIYLFGLISGVFLSAILLMSFNGPFKTGREQLAICESSLPRNQQCVITAVPAGDHP